MFQNTKRVKKKKKSRLLSLLKLISEDSLEFYTEIGKMFIGNGVYDKASGLASDQLFVGFRKIFTDNSERVAYVISGYPTFTDRELMQDIRLKVERYGVAVNFQCNLEPYIIDWENSQMKEQKEVAQAYVKQMDKKHIDSFSTRTDLYAKESGLRMAETFGYYTSIEDRNQMLCRTSIFIDIWCTKSDERAKLNFKLAQRKFRSFCTTKGFSFQELKFKLYDYLKYMNPASGFTHPAQTFEVKNILSDEIVARLLGYTGGVIGRTGVLMGKDIFNNKLVYKSLVSKTGDAENMMVVAESGGGKSFYVKVLLIMMLANGFNSIVFDIDREYEHLTRELNGIVVSFDSSYFDTTEISEPTGDPVIDMNMLIESRQATATVFSTLTDIEKGMSPVERKIFTEAYNRMYDDVNLIIEDQSTWGRSKGLSYHKLYEYIKAFRYPEESRKINVDAKSVQEFVAKLGTFLDPTGLHSYLFKNKITINDVFSRTSKEPLLVDIALNLQKNATSGEELIVQTVKQLTANYLSTLIANRNKKNGQFTSEVIEEYQRYASQANVSEMILTKITGNRKRNMNTILVTNSPLQLLNSATASAFAVIENINNFVIGALKERSIEAVCETFNLDYCEPLLRKIANKPKYKHTFLVKLNKRDVTAVKWKLGKELEQSKIFITRDISQTEKDIATLSWEDMRNDVKQKQEEGRKILIGKRAR